MASDSDGFSRYLDQVRRLPRLEREEELALAARCKAGDAAAGHALVEGHLRDVVAIAAKYRGYGFRLADLVEEGNIGLLEAARRFDPSRGLRFMTYGAYWVRAYDDLVLFLDDQLFGVCIAFFEEALQTDVMLDDTLEVAGTWRRTSH